uniref:Uncharacterized protein n=1 Tax=Glossina austeni TaxID=7395 RepID=A0A1A9VLK8_GLOAU
MSSKHHPQRNERHQAPNRDPYLAKARRIAVNATSHAYPTDKQAANVRKLTPITRFHPRSGSGKRRIDTTSDDTGLHFEGNLISATVIVADRRVTATVDTGATTSFNAAVLAREIEKTCRRDPKSSTAYVAISSFHYSNSEGTSTPTAAQLATRFQGLYTVVRFESPNIIQVDTTTRALKHVHLQDAKSTTGPGATVPRGGAAPHLHKQSQ